VSPLPNATVNVLGSQSAAVQGVAAVVLRQGNYVKQVKAAVMDTAPFDVIISDHWLKKRHALIDMQGGHVLFRDKGKLFSLQCVSDRMLKQSLKSTAAPVIMSALQAKRIMRKPVDALLALVTPVVPDSVNSDLPANVQMLVKDFDDVFTDHAHYGGSNLHAEHEVIPLIDGAKPVRKPMFRYSPLEMEEMESQLRDLLVQGYIHPSTSPYAAPVLFVQQPRSDKLRYCFIDYRALNKVNNSQLLSVAAYPYNAGHALQCQGDDLA
jgi:hypothetical protein